MNSPANGGGIRIDRVVLLGYMCSGKSAVGEALARRLEWRFLDFDVEIEKREDQSISELIENEGEDYFRSREAALTEEIADERSLVIAPGGAWITQPELLEMIRRGTLSVWLAVSPDETVRRLREDPVDRPFKNHPNPIEPISEMIADREPLYRRADLLVPAGSRSVQQIAFEIEQVVRTRRGG